MGFRGSDSRSRDSGFGFKISGFEISGFRVEISGFMVEISGFRVKISGSGVKNLPTRPRGGLVRLDERGGDCLVSGFRVQGSGFRVQCSGFRVQGSGCRVGSVQDRGERVTACPESPVKGSPAPRGPKANRTIGCVASTCLA